MNELHYATARAVADLLARELDLPFQDCLVMRLGTGAERNNAEAILAYLESPGQEALVNPLSSLSSARHRLAQIRAAAIHLRQRLEQQTLDLWMMAIPPSPQACDFVSQTALLPRQQRQLAHALITLLSAGRPIGDVEAQCLACLPGTGSATARLVQWLEARNPHYTYNASELLLPLAKALLLDLCPDYTPD